MPRVKFGWKPPPVLSSCLGRGSLPQLLSRGANDLSFEFVATRKCRCGVVPLKSTSQRLRTPEADALTTLFRRRARLNRSAALKLLGFLILPMFNVVTPLITLPAITSRFGAEAWAGIAIAQSVGSASSVLIELGWGLNGAQRIARQGVGNRRQTLALSFLTRGLVVLPVAPIAVVATLLIATDYRAESAVVAVATSLATINSVWFFIGTGEPSKIITTESLPRLLPVVASAMLIMCGAPLWVYGAALLVASLGSPLVVMRAVRLTRSDFTVWRTGSLIRVIQAQSSALVGRLLSATYIALPVALVGIAYPQSVAVFAAAERLQRMALSVLQAIPNALQGWVGTPSLLGERLRRARIAVLLNAVVGCVAGLVFTLAAPTAAELIFSGIAPISTQLASLCGLMILIVCCSRATGGLMLVAMKRIDIIALSALAGCMIGVPAILFLASVWGVAGGVAGEVAAELAVLAVQIIGLARPGRAGWSLAAVRS
jgi:hypothetical protein